MRSYMAYSPASSLAPPKRKKKRKIKDNHFLSKMGIAIMAFSLIFVNYRSIIWLTFGCILGFQGLLTAFKMFTRQSTK